MVGTNLVGCHFQYLTRFLEKVVADHEETIRELEDENTGVYDLLTEQKNLDTSVATVEQTATRHTVSEGQTTRRQTVEKQTVVDVQESVRKSSGYHLCGRCRSKIGAREDTKSSKIGFYDYFVVF